MSLWVLLTLSALLLVVPRGFMPARGPKPEIHGALRLLWWINVLYCDFWHDLESGGPAPLPARGPALLIANHTCGVDPMVLQAGCHRVLRFLVAQEWYDYWAVRPLCRLLGAIPVRRDGRDLSATRAALRALEAGHVVPIFPEGQIVPTSGRELGEGKPGVAFIALRTRVPVIPAYIRGTPPTTNIWKAVLTPSHARVVYAPPIDLSDIPTDQPIDKATLAAVTDRLMGAIRDLRARSLASDDAARPMTPAPAEDGDDVPRPERLAGALSGDRASPGRA